MCTLALAWKVFEDAPVVVGANRDEALDRPSHPPAVSRGEPTVVAPRDREAGGTWIGFNDRGLFAGITNRWTDAELAGERSRGLLVDDVLARESAREAAALAERSVGEVEYAGFNLLVADATDAVWLTWDGSLDRLALDPGVHVAVNVGLASEPSIPASRGALGREQAENARAVERALETDHDRTRALETDHDPTGALETDHDPTGALEAEDDPTGALEADDPAGTLEADDRTAADWLDRAGAVLGDHEYGVCLHRDGFGTRSSSLLATGRSPRYAFADGPPCRSRYRPVDLEGQF